MKTLDRYVARSFLYSVLMLTVVMLSMRTVTDLFVNMDEFAEKDQGFLAMTGDVVSYYGYHMLAYLAELGGVIIVASAGFSIARMNRSNELTAIMASGVSLHRVLLPIVVCAAFVSGLIFFDREVLIPSVARHLVARRDGGEGKKARVWFVTDSAGTAWYSPELRTAELKLMKPRIILRQDGVALGMISGAEAKQESIRDHTGKKIQGWMISDRSVNDDGTVIETAAGLSLLADTDRPWANSPRATEIWTSLAPAQVSAAVAAGKQGTLELADPDYQMVVRAKAFEFQLPDSPDQSVGGLLTRPTFTFTAESGRVMAIFTADSATYERDPIGTAGLWKLTGGKLFCPSDLTIADIVLRQSSRWLEYMSIRQLNSLLKLRRVPDPGAALLTKHIRIAEPLYNLVMLLVGVPFILSRERNVKASALRCLLMVGAVYISIYLCRYIGLSPVWAAWAPVVIFGPVAAVMLDSIKS